MLECYLVCIQDRKFTFIKIPVRAFFLFLHFVAATLFLSRLRKRLTASCGANSFTLIRFTANFDPGGVFDPSDSHAAVAVAAVGDLVGEGNPGTVPLISLPPLPIFCRILILKPSLINCEVYAWTLIEEPGVEAYSLVLALDPEVVSIAVTSA